MVAEGDTLWNASQSRADGSQISKLLGWLGERQLALAMVGR